jgi:hypothetical protein
VQTSCHHYPSNVSVQSWPFCASAAFPSSRVRERSRVTLVIVSERASYLVCSHEAEPEASAKQARMLL